MIQAVTELLRTIKIVALYIMKEQTQKEASHQYSHPQAVVVMIPVETIFQISIRFSKKSFRISVIEVCKNNTKF